MNIAFYDSEVSLYDSFALGEILKNSKSSCEILERVSINFADKIYEEARELEKFDSSNKLTNSIKSIHRKYDLLRTLLWANVINLKERCEINTVVYLYVYDTQEISSRSKQVVWSRILGELKFSRGNDFILIPVAVDNEILSLDYLVEEYGVEEFPAVIVNEKDVFYDHETVEELEKYLK
jgi:predicted phosphatase